MYNIEMSYLSESLQRSVPVVMPLLPVDMP